MTEIEYIMLRQSILEEGLKQHMLDMQGHIHQTRMLIDTLGAQLNMLSTQYGQAYSDLDSKIAQLDANYGSQIPTVPPPEEWKT